MHFTSARSSVCSQVRTPNDWFLWFCVQVGRLYLPQLAVVQAEALAVGQRVAPLGAGGPAGGRGGAVAHGPPPRHHHLAAGLVLVQSAFASVDHPGTEESLSLSEGENRMLRLSWNNTERRMVWVAAARRSTRTRSTTASRFGRKKTPLCLPPFSDHETFD